MAVTTQKMTEYLDLAKLVRLPELIQQEFEDELAEQKLIGRRPTLILIDKGKHQRIEDVEYRAQAFYDTDVAKVAEAAHIAWDMLTAQTRVKTGRARASFKLYLRGREMGGVEAIERVA